MTNFHYIYQFICFFIRTAGCVNSHDVPETVGKSRHASEPCRASHDPKGRANLYFDWRVPRNLIYHQAKSMLPQCMAIPGILQDPNVLGSTDTENHIMILRYQYEHLISIDS